MAAQQEYKPNNRWNKVRAERDPLSRYYKPNKQPGYVKDPISNANEARIEELLRKNTYGDDLTEDEVRELRALADRPGLEPIVRYHWSVTNYKSKRAGYKSNLKQYKNTKQTPLTNANKNRLRKLHKNYKNLTRAESKFNYPHQLERLENIPGENYQAVPMANVMGSIIRVDEGGRRKTRRAKRKGRKGTRRA